jgi:hypothetical protein
LLNLVSGKTFIERGVENLHLDIPSVWFAGSGLASQRSID